MTSELAQLKEAVKNWQNLENFNANETDEERHRRESYFMDLEYPMFSNVYDCSPLLPCCWRDSWCSMCHGRKPNRCSDCYVYTFGQYCPVCLIYLLPTQGSKRRRHKNQLSNHIFIQM